jgi:hypothetical protein
VTRLPTRPWARSRAEFRRRPRRYDTRVPDAPRRKTGRPPLDPTDPISVNVCVTLPSKKFDQVYADARAKRMTISEYVRYRLARPATRPDPDR